MWFNNAVPVASSSDSCQKLFDHLSPHPTADLHEHRKPCDHETLHSANVHNRCSLLSKYSLIQSEKVKELLPKTRLIDYRPITSVSTSIRASLLVCLCRSVDVDWCCLPSFPAHLSASLYLADRSSVSQNQFRDADNTGHSHDDDQSLNRFFKKRDTTDKGQFEEDNLEDKRTRCLLLTLPGLLFLTGCCGVSVKCSPMCSSRWDQGGSNSNGSSKIGQIGLSVRHSVV